MKREMKEMFRDVQRQGKEKGGCDNMRATKEYRLKVTEEAQKIVDQLTLEQKVSLMSGSIVDLNKVTQEQIMEMMGGMGINSIEALRGNRLMLRGVGLTEKELSILGVFHAGE